MSLTQESVLCFLLEHGGKVKNCELLSHFRSAISCGGPAEKQHNRELFKRVVNSVAVVKQIDEVKFVVVKKRYQDFAKDAAHGDAPKLQSDDSFSSQNSSFSSPHRSGEMKSADSGNNNYYYPEDKRVSAESRHSKRRRSSRKTRSAETTTVKVLNISGDEANRNGKSGPVFAVIAVKSPPRGSDNAQRTVPPEKQIPQGSKAVHPRTSPEKQILLGTKLVHPCATPEKQILPGTKAVHSCKSPDKQFLQGTKAVHPCTSPEKQIRQGSKIVHPSPNPEKQILQGTKGVHSCKSLEKQITQGTKFGHPCKSPEKQTQQGAKGVNSCKSPEKKILQGTKAVHPYANTEKQIAQGTKAVHLRKSPEKQIVQETKVEDSFKSAENQILQGIKLEAEKQIRQGTKADAPPLLPSNHSVCMKEALRESQRWKTRQAVDPQGRTLAKDTKYNESVPLDALAHDWLVKCAAGLWGQVSTLLRKDARLAQRRDFMSGFTALHWAAKYGNCMMIHKLMEVSLRKGVHVNINGKAHGGYTPLHIAAIHGRTDVIVALVQNYGANVNERDNDGKKALHYLGGGVSCEVRALVGGAQRRENAEEEEEEKEESKMKNFNTISKLFQPHMGKKQKTKLSHDW